ncbi:hypothetical protein LEMLEM_LOCUS9055 [Lemmus lemmus]
MSVARPSTIGQGSQGTRGFIVGRNPTNASSVGKTFVGAQTSSTTPSSMLERSPMNAVMCGKAFSHSSSLTHHEGCTVRETLPVKQIRKGPSQVGRLLSTSENSYWKMTFLMQPLRKILSRQKHPKRSASVYNVNKHCRLLLVI